MRVKLTQVEAARRLAKAVSTIKGWESAQGTEPATLDDVVRVCNLYGIPIDYYVSGQCGDTRLSADQQRLLKAYSSLSPETQKALLLTLEQLEQELTRQR